MYLKGEIDPHARVNVLAEDEDGFWYNHNTSAGAKNSWKRAWKWRNDVARVVPCDHCGRLGLESRVQYRWGVTREGLHGKYAQTPMLCMGCWNTARAVARRWDALAELRAITKGLRRGKRKHDDGGSEGEAA